MKNTLTLLLALLLVGGITGQTITQAQTDGTEQNEGGKKKKEKE